MILVVFIYDITRNISVWVFVFKVIYRIHKRFSKVSDELTSSYSKIHQRFRTRRSIRWRGRIILIFHTLIATDELGRSLETIWPSQ
jgi:hypothetical protein